jgi:hypothetical protein
MIKTIKVYWAIELLLLHGYDWRALKYSCCRIPVVRRFFTHVVSINKH